MNSAVSSVSGGAGKPIRCKFTMAKTVTSHLDNPPCNRRPLWYIKHVGYGCQFHYEEYITTHVVDPADVIRLSEREEDFVVKAPPGKGHSGNKTKKKVK